MRSCKRCGVELPPRPVGHRGAVPVYCDECRKLRRREVRDATRPAPPSPIRPTLAPRTCTECGTEFLPDRRTQKFCSRACRFAAAYAAKKADGRLALQAQRQREAYVPQPPRRLVCAECGTEFTQTGRGRSRRYCSKQCATSSKGGLGKCVTTS